MKLKTRMLFIAATLISSMAMAQNSYPCHKQTDPHDSTAYVYSPVHQPSGYHDSIIYRDVKDSTWIIPKKDFWCKWFGLCDASYWSYSIKKNQPVDTLVNHDTVLYKKTPVHITAAPHDTIVSCIVIPPADSTVFGAKITAGTFDQQHNALQDLSVNVVRPNSITLNNWMPGSKARVDDFLEAGYTCLLNLSWDESRANTVIPFCKDLVAYNNKLSALIKQYAAWAKKGKLIFIIENEEFNRGYFSGPIKDYLDLLNIAVNVCQANDVPLADGALALEFVNMLRTGSYAKANEGQVKKIDTLINFFTNIAYNKFYVNTHIKLSGPSYKATTIEDNCAYLRQRTGKIVLSNEWHVVNATDALMDDAVAHWRAAAVPYSIVFDENKGQGGAITDGSGNTTKIGDAYSAAILK